MLEIFNKVKGLYSGLPESVKKYAPWAGGLAGAGLLVWGAFKIFGKPKYGWRK